MTTNNGSESYHGRLKPLIKCCKPRIWNFLDTLNEIIIDTDNELARIKEGLEITRKRKKINIDNEERCSKCKENLLATCLIEQMKALQLNPFVLSGIRINRCNL